MKKMFILVLLSPFAFAEPKTSIDATCYFYWDTQADRDKCIKSLKKVKKFEDAYLPFHAEMKTVDEYKKKEREDNRGAWDDFIMPPPPKPKQETSKKETSNKIDSRTHNCEVLKKSNLLTGITEVDAECKKLLRKKYKNDWEQELNDSAFYLTSNSNEFFHFMSNGILDGYTMSSTKDDDGKDWGFDMQGAWEITYGNEDEGHVSIYAGKLECRYSISKKGVLYWFEKIEANYSNICVDMLMKRQKLIPIEDYEG